jgi:hypothetical protein
MYQEIMVQLAKQHDSFMERMRVEDKKQEKVEAMMKAQQDVCSSIFSSFSPLLFCATTLVVFDNGIYI